MYHARMIDVVEPPPPECLADPYALEAWLEALPAADRELVERGMVASLGHRSMARWKEHHAFGIGLGRPLDALPPGSYAFFFCGDEPLREVLPETLEPLDLESMAQLDDEHGGAFFKHAEAPSLFELLRIMVAHGDLGIDPDPSPTDSLWRDEQLAAAWAHLRPIRDPYLRRIAAELSGEGWQLERIAEYEQAVYCQGILVRRPGWSFVMGWDATPPVQDVGACILYRPADDDAGATPPRRRAD